MRQATIPKIEKALRSAHWQAISNPRFEYRVLASKDGKEISIDERISGDNSYYRNSIYLHTFRFPEGVRNRIREQHDYITMDLSYDAENAIAKIAFITDK